MQKYYCERCDFTFEHEEPEATIPVSVVYCPKCGLIAEKKRRRP